MSPNIGLDFHHMGLATRHADQTRRALSALGYQLGETVYDPLQNVNLIWGSHVMMPAVEIVYPADGPGPLDPYLSDFSELVYHVCYEADTIEAAVTAMKAAGMRIVSVVPPKPAVLFGGRLVEFFAARGLGLVEILEKQRPAGDD